MRIPQPHWKESHNCHYVKLKGKFYRLDPDKEKAWEMWRELISRFNMKEGLRPAKSVTAREVLDTFLDWVAAHRKPDTFAWYRQYILGTGGKSGKYRDAGFRNWLPAGLTVRDLKPHHLNRWIDARYPKANDTTRGAAITAVKQAFKWSKREGYIDENPIQEVKKPRPRSRGDVAYISPEQWTQIFEHVESGRRLRSGTSKRKPARRSAREIEAFLDYLVVMRATGCRPQEIRIVEARHLDHKTKRWIFDIDESKSGKKTGKRRIVNLGDEAYQVCRRLALKYPEGPLFRNSEGRPWTKFAIAHRFAHLSREVGFKVFPYAIRHTFATDAIKAGCDVVSVARLMGHSSLDMLNEVYEHVSVDQQHMEHVRQKASGRVAG